MKSINGHFLKTKNRNPSFNLIVGTHKTKKYSELKWYQIKMYKLGDIYEVYKYELPVYAGYHKFKKYNNSNSNDENKKLDNRKKVVTRIRNRVRRLALANFDEHSRFFTSTFADNIKEMNFANREFKKFIQRLKYHYGDFKYLTVVEFQKKRCDTLSYAF